MGSIIFVAVAQKAEDHGALRRGIRNERRRGLRGRGRGGFDLGGIVARLKRYDANGDKIITTEELPDWLAGFVGRVDGDDDGELSFEEIDAMIEEMKSRSEGGGRRRGSRGGRGSEDGEGRRGGGENRSGGDASKLR